MSVRKQGMPPSLSFLASGSIAGRAKGQGTLFGRTSQPIVDYFGAWHRVLRSMDFIPQYFFVDSGIRRKKLGAVAGDGCVLAPARTFWILGVDHQTSGPVCDKQVKEIGRWCNHRRRRSVGTADFFARRNLIRPVRRPSILAVKRRSAGVDNGHCMLGGKEPVVARIRQRISAWPMSAGVKDALNLSARPSLAPTSIK